MISESSDFHEYISAFYSHDQAAPFFGDAFFLFAETKSWFLFSFFGNFLFFVFFLT